MNPLTDAQKQALSHLRSVGISKRFCCQLTQQSCDCDSLAICNGETCTVLRYRALGEDDACIDFEFDAAIKEADYPYFAELGQRDFSLEEVHTLDCGKIQVLGFRAQDIFLYISAGMDNLILCLSKEDFFLDGLAEEDSLRIYKKQNL